MTALPAEGYDGDVPEFPLPKRIVWYEYFEGSGKEREKKRENDEGATEGVWERELELWESLWRTPQACAWSMVSESWRRHTIAMYVRTFVLCESSEATAADKGSLHRFADQIGLTPAGLAENGWAIATDEVAAKAAEKAEQAEEPAEGDEVGQRRQKRLR
ncbi:hypothetical protein [Pimelobacter simplex]|uniref:hypothetical protein n=1 Tax=Nocardioides simplex TaxID=2045 RepID=UPI003AAAC0F6